MKDVDEYIQLNYSNYCDLLLLGFTFVNEKLSVRYWIYVTAVILTSVMNIKGKTDLDSRQNPGLSIKGCC